MNKIVFGIIGIILILTLFLAIKSSISGSSIKEVSSKDICEPSPGYTEETWRTHMSHHPDMYKKCLNK